MYELHPNDVSPALSACSISPEGTESEDRLCVDVPSKNGYTEEIQPPYSIRRNAIIPMVTSAL